MGHFQSNGQQYNLYPWQQDAISKWKAENNRGIVQATTGSGKSRVAHSIIVEWLKKPDSIVSVVVPQIALLNQWAETLDDILGFSVGRIGGGKLDWNARINVMVVNSGLKVLPEKGVLDSHLIVADECHRMAAPTFARIFDIDHDAALGLSATPEREDSGLEILQQLIGDVIYQFGYDEALQSGVIADFEVCAVQIPLTPFEKQKHDEAHQMIVSLSKSLGSRYGNRGNLILLCNRLLANGTDDSAVGAFLKAVRERKEVLDAARNRFAALDLLLHNHKMNKKMVFHESIEDIDKLEKRYSHLSPLVYHSKRTAKKRREALADFTTSESGLLLSCRALVEGVDIPDADVGIMVSGTRSVRSRIQTIGRLLRKGGREQPTIYLFYIPNTSDEKSVSNLLSKGFPKDKLRFMVYNPSNQAIEDKNIDVDALLKKNSWRRKNPRQPQDCEKCGRRFKSEVGLKTHHCVPLEEQTWDDFLKGFER